MSRITIASGLVCALLVSLTPVAGAVPPGTDPPIEQVAYLKSSSSVAQGTFGNALALGASTLVVGAPGETVGTVTLAGAAYVFVRDGSGWSEQARLQAPSPGPIENFGRSVAISGETAVIGTSNVPPIAPGNSAYVFVRNGTSWTRQASLASSNREVGDNFGFAVAADGNTVVVGAYGEDSHSSGVNGNQTSNSRLGSGAAYFFVRNGTSWSQQAYLKASNTDSDDRFGFSVAISGNTIAVSAPNEASSATGVNGNESSNTMIAAGAVYVFVRNGTTWSQEAYVKASNTAAGDGFGGKVALLGNTLVVAANEEDSASTGVNGNQVNNSAAGAGAVYVFTRAGTSWSQEAYLKASNTGPGDSFGFSLGLSVDTLVVGAAREDSNASGVNGSQTSNSLPNSGAAYLFRRTGTSWSQTAYLKASLPGDTDFFGASVALASDALAVGAPLENQLALDSGAVYAFDLGLQGVVAFRNAGSNPSSYTASAIESGLTFTATVDNNLAGQLTSLLFGYDTAVSILLGGGQTLLCVDFGSGELFTGANLAPTSSAGGVDTYELAIPADPSLVGRVFSSQAIQFGHPPFDLSNAQDFTIGGF